MNATPSARASLRGSIVLRGPAPVLAFLIALSAPGALRAAPDGAPSDVRTAVGLTAAYGPTPRALLSRSGRLHLGRSLPLRVKLSLAGGFVPGLPMGRPSGAGNRNRPSPAFDPFRRMGLTIAVGSRFEIGAVAVRLTEPDAGIYRRGTAPPPLREMDWLLRDHATGFFAAVVVRPGQSPRRRAGLAFGAGLGAVHAGRRQGSSRPDGFFGSASDDADESRRARFAAIAFAEWTVRLSKDVSFGVSVDRVFAPSLTLPPRPDFGIRARALRTSTPSVGLVANFAL